MKRIFISSVQKEFARERMLLKKFIEGNPILRRYFEVFVYELSVPARDKTTRQIYLDELRKSDVYLAFIGRDYGYVDAEGVSPTEREFDEATRLGMTRLVFVEGGCELPRVDKEASFLQKISRSLSWMRFDDGEGLLSGVYASLDEMIVAEGRLLDLPFDAARCERATMSDVSRSKIREFLVAAREKRGLSLSLSLRPEKVLEHFHLRDAGTGCLTNSALLLFGKDPQRFFLTSYVKCVQWPTSERHKPIRDHRVVTGTLFEMADSAVQFVLDKLEKRIGSRAESLDATAPMTYDIPREVVTEAIVNAIVHRDYSSNGSVQVELFHDRLLVMSPGGMHPSVDARKLAVAHPSFPVNPLLAEPLYQTGHIERMGTGLEDLFAACRKAGLKRPKIEISAHEVHLTIFRRRSQGAVRVQSGCSQGAVGALPVKDRCVKLLRSGELGKKQIAEGLGLAVRSGYLLRVLSELIEEGLVERTISDPRRKNSRLQKYRLTTSSTPSNHHSSPSPSSKT